MIMIALTGAHPSSYRTEGRTFKKDKYKTKGKPMKGYHDSGYYGGPTYGSGYGSFDYGSSYGSGYGSGYGSSYGSGYNTGIYGSYEGHGVTFISNLNKQC